MSSDQFGSSAGGEQSSLNSLKDQAGEAVSDAANHLKHEAARREEGIRGSISKQADQLASALRSVKSDIDPQSGIGKMVDYAADSVGSIAENLKTADTTEMIDGVRSFARERPGAFLGVAALAGFAAARFFVASAPAGTGGGHGSYGSTRTAPGGGTGVDRSGLSGAGAGRSGGGQAGPGTTRPGTSSLGVGTGAVSGQPGVVPPGGTTGTAGSEAGGDYTSSSSVAGGSGSARVVQPGQSLTEKRDSDGGRND